MKLFKNKIFYIVSAVVLVGLLAFGGWYLYQQNAASGPLSFDWKTVAIVKDADIDREEDTWESYTVSYDDSGSNAEYSVQMQKTNPDFGTRSVKVGDTGDDVKAIQAIMVYMGEDSVKVTGVFSAEDAKTLNLLIADPDYYTGGEVNQKALFALLESLEMFNVDGGR